MATSIKYTLNGTDGTLILGNKARGLQSFKALNWTDLRFTIACSLTKESDPNDVGGLAEQIGSGEDNNQVYMGFKQSDALFPPETNFWGLSTQQATPTSEYTELADVAGAQWQIGREISRSFCLFASNGTSKQNNASGLGGGSRFPQVLSVSEYAQIIILRMTRNDPTSTVVDTLEAELTSNQVDNGTTFIGDTTTANLRSITAAATYSTILGPWNFTVVPDALYFYWPFSSSRLRLHNYVIEKYA